MKALTKTGPKRLRATRRETSPVSRQGWVGQGPRYERAAAKRQTMTIRKAVTA